MTDKYYLKDKCENLGRFPTWHVVGYSNRNKLLEFLIEGRGFAYHIFNISENININRPSIYSELKPLLKLKIVRKKRSNDQYDRKLFLYQINKENKQAEILINLFDMLINSKLKEDIKNHNR